MDLTLKRYNFQDTKDPKIGKDRLLLLDVRLLSKFDCPQAFSDRDQDGESEC